MHNFCFKSGHISDQCYGKEFMLFYPLSVLLATFFNGYVSLAQVTPLFVAVIFDSITKMDGYLRRNKNIAERILSVMCTVTDASIVV